MRKHEEKVCVRCRASFTCKAGDIANCQCNQVRLSAEAQEFLSNSYFDCLCRNCLEQVNEVVKVAKRYRFPTQKEMLVEGLHYYKEGGQVVFTELYHVLRGHCCRNGCRHCAYGFMS